MIMFYLLPLKALNVNNTLSVNNETLRRVDCLLDLEFYHPESDQCFPALEQGPCDGDEWLLPDISDPGLGRCQQRTLEDKDCAEAVILENGEVGCREDVDNIDVPYTKGKCEIGELLLPENFQNNRRPCPAKFKCSTNYRNTLNSIKRIYAGNIALANKAREHFSDMICNPENPRALCIPENKKSKLLPENLYQSFQIPKLVCKKNPCLSYQKPNPNELGSYVCQNVLGLNSATHVATSLCRPRQRWSKARGKCIAKFFG